LPKFRKWIRKKIRRNIRWIGDIGKEERYFTARGEYKPEERGK
jgi:hypothetical protein